MKLGIQLFTVRDTMNSAENIRMTFRRLKRMGYDEAQTCDCAIPHAEFGRIAREEGIDIVGTHEGFGNMVNHTDIAIENHRALGAHLMGIGVYNFTDEASIHEFAREANRVGAAIAPYGMKFTYHNHYEEFIKVNGKLIMDYLAEELDPEVTSFVLDTYWVQFGGGDVCGWIEKLAGRIDLLHLKDMAVNSDGPYITECGNGNLDFPKIIAAAKRSGVKYFCVEQDDCPDDPFVSAEISARYLKPLLG